MSVTVPPVPPESAEDYQPQTQFGGLLMDAMSPWLTLHLAWLLDAIGAMADPTYLLVSDVGVDDGTMPTIGTLDKHGQLITEGYQPGYGALLNPTICPVEDLPFLGQFVGVEIPTGTDETTARSLVKQESGRNRGTPGAVQAAARRNLTGNRQMWYLERRYLDGTYNEGWAGLVIRKDDCPDLSAVVRAVEAVKFGGVLMWYLLVTGWPWIIQTDTWETDPRTWADAAHHL